MTETTISRRERKKEETKERIFKVAVELFRTKGFDATTIDEITEKADVAKGTFFNYFPRKEAVLGYLAEVRMQRALDEAEAILSERRPAREKILSLFLDVASSYQEDRELSWFVLMESIQRELVPGEDVHHRWHELAARVIARGQETGELKVGIDPRRAELVLHSVFMGTVFMWLRCPETMLGELDLASEIRERFDLVFDGLSA
jgi:AcrR family transcriptional regulator